MPESAPFTPPPDVVWLPDGYSWPELLHAARDALAYAYAPYSYFTVGAAVLMSRRRTSPVRLITGANVENASYGLTICAERSAIVRAAGEGRRVLHALLVVTNAPTPTAPCGACRQVLHEFAVAPSMPIMSVAKGGAQRHWTIEQLLPEAFGPKDLDGHDGDHP